MPWVLGLALVALVALVAKGASSRAAAVALDPSSRARDDASEPEDPAPLSPGAQQAIRAMHPIVLQAIAKVVGRPASAFEGQYVHGVTWNETSDGTGWIGTQAAARDAHNWGAVQCDSSNEGPDTCVPGLTDHTSGGTEFHVGFRRYASDLDGAADAAKHVLVLRPRTASALASDHPTALRASFAMRRERYYGGICPTATKTIGVQAATDSFAHPDKDEATRACAREAIIAHARAVQKVARYVASLDGSPALPMGTYEDAERWYHALDGKAAA